MKGTADTVAVDDKRIICVNFLPLKPIAVIAFGLLWSTSTFSEGYPAAKPIRLIVPGSPGGVADIRARWVSERLNAALGRPIIVDNRSGAGGNIAMEVAAKSPKDGYTLVIVIKARLR